MKYNSHKHYADIFSNKLQNSSPERFYFPELLTSDIRWSEGIKSEA